MMKFNKVFSYNLNTGETVEIEEVNIDRNSFVPTRIVYNNPYTICYFNDGDRIICKCADGEKFSKEVGVAECIAKKVFGTRADFLKLVKSGHTVGMKPLKNPNVSYVPDEGRAILTVEEFVVLCISGYLTDDDGVGYYTNGKTYNRNNKALPSEMIWEKNVREDFKYVVWFNK